MTMTFRDSMVKMIQKYREVLRRALPQSERVNKLQELDLRNPNIMYNEIQLYHLGNKISEHLVELGSNKGSYYSYSGITKFADHLSKFLSQYRVDPKTGHVLHTVQLASRAIVEAAQILAFNSNFEEHVEKLERCHRILLTYGTDEQIEVYETALNTMLRKQGAEPNNFYRLAMKNFMKCIDKKEAIAI